MNNRVYISKVRQRIDDYRNSDESWIKELFEITEKYFLRRVLPLFAFHPLTEEDKIEMLYHGFLNILNQYESKKHQLLPTNNSLLDWFLSAQRQENISKPLDKTDIDMKLFQAFYGFTFVAIKDYYFLTELDDYNQEKLKLTIDKENLKTTLEDFQKLINDYEIDKRYLNNELAIAQGKLKERANRGRKEKNSSIRYTDLLRENSFENDLKRIAEETRKRNGKLNFSKIASKIGGISNHTAKNWCKKYKIPLEVPYLKN